MVHSVDVTAMQAGFPRAPEEPLGSLKQDFLRSDVLPVAFHLSFRASVTGCVCLFVYHVFIFIVGNFNITALCHGDNVGSRSWLPFGNFVCFHKDSLLIRK